jgi:hypothetical protein
VRVTQDGFAQPDERSVVLAIQIVHVERGIHARRENRCSHRRTIGMGPLREHIRSA